MIAPVSISLASFRPCMSELEDHALAIAFVLRKRLEPHDAAADLADRPPSTPAACYWPIRPSMRSRSRSACPLWRAYSSIMCTSSSRSEIGSPSESRPTKSRSWSRVNCSAKAISSCHASHAPAVPGGLAPHRAVRQQPGRGRPCAAETAATPDARDQDHDRTSDTRRRSRVRPEPASRTLRDRTRSTPQPSTRRRVPPTGNGNVSAASDENALPYAPRSGNATDPARADRQVRPPSGLRRTVRVWFGEPTHTRADVVGCTAMPW
jgi:hypothetical protein